MFGRFTDGARRVITAAQADARHRRQDRIRSENLLIGLFDAPATPGAVLLGQLGVDRTGVDGAIRARYGKPGEHDAGALAALGIDLDEVRRQAERTFGPGALERGPGRRRPRFGGRTDFDRDARKVLELTLREALRLGDRHVGTEHLLLGLLHDRTGDAQEIMAERGVGLSAVRAAVVELGRGAANG